MLRDAGRLSPDGERFLLSVMPEKETRIPLTVAVDWNAGAQSDD